MDENNDIKIDISNEKRSVTIIMLNLSLLLKLNSLPVPRGHAPDTTPHYHEDRYLRARFSSFFLFEEFFIRNLRI
jgi:hypothetical protein